MTYWYSTNEDDWTKEKINELINDHYKTLYLKYINLGDKGSKLLADEFKEERLKGFTELYLINCLIKEEGIKSIMKEIHHLKSLIVLDLDGNEFGPNGGIIIANELSHLTSLQELNLHGNNIGPYSSIAITNEVKNLPKFRWINFNNNNIGKEGYKAIIDILPNRIGKEIIEVNFEHNNLTDDVLKEIEEKCKTKNLGVIAYTGSSTKDPPNPPTFVYKNAYQIIEYQYLSKGFNFPSLCFLSLSIIRDGEVKVPDHCIQATNDAIDRELENGLKLQTSIKEEIIINPTSNKQEVEKFHIVSLSNIILRKTKL